MIDKQEKWTDILDRIAIILLALFFIIKISTCLTGCGSIENPPKEDGYQHIFIDAGLLSPDSHQTICGDRICESPWETMTNCPKDCLPEKWKSDNPLDPGYVDPINPPWNKK